MQQKVQIPNLNKIQATISSDIIHQKWKYYILNISRGGGKSVLGEILSIYWALTFPKSKILWVYPKEKQAKERYRELKKKLDPNNCILSATEQQGSVRIEIDNGSEILFRGAEAADSQRGLHVDYMIIDEASFIPSEIYFSVFRPMMLKKGKKLILISTPNGEGFFKDFFMNGMKNDLEYKSYIYNCYELENPDLKYLETEKQINPFFNQEYLCEFENADSPFKNIELCCNIQEQLEPLLNDKYYFGIDIGIVNDATIVSIINQHGSCINQIEVQGDTNNIINTIISLYKKWQPKGALIEENGQGLPIYEQIKRQIQIQPFWTSNTSKNDILNDLMYAFNTNIMKCINNVYLKMELQNFKAIKTNTGLIKMEAKSGHDDRVMSLAIAYHCYNTKRYNDKGYNIFDLAADPVKKMELRKPKNIWKMDDDDSSQFGAIR